MLVRCVLGLFPRQFPYSFTVPRFRLTGQIVIGISVYYGNNSESEKRGGKWVMGQKCFFLAGDGAAS